MSELRATPTTAEAMAAHLCDAIPVGHGMDLTDAADMTLEQLSVQHDRMHGDAMAPHDHGPIDGTRGKPRPPTGDFEVRGTDLWPDEDMEIRSIGDGLSFEGYALAWDKWSHPIPGGPRGNFRETFRQGSMARTLARNPDIVLTHQHMLSAFPLGRTTAGTFSVTADGYGLRTSGEFPDNALGQMARDAIRRRDVSGMSIRFRVPSTAGQKWSTDYGEREILEAAIGPEISLVTFPAYPDTTATVRHLAEAANLEPDALAEAFDILHQPDGQLSTAQRDLIYAAVASKTDAPHLSPKVAAMRERLAALAS